MGYLVTHFGYCTKIPLYREVIFRYNRGWSSPRNGLYVYFQFCNERTNRVAFFDESAWIIRIKIPRRKGIEHLSCFNGIVESLRWKFITIFPFLDFNSIQYTVIFRCNDWKLHGIREKDFSFIWKNRFDDTITAAQVETFNRVYLSAILPDTAFRIPWALGSNKDQRSRN